MDDIGFLLQDDLINQIDWEHLLDDVPADFDVTEIDVVDAPLPSTGESSPAAAEEKEPSADVIVQGSSNSDASPEAVISWIDELLVNDNDVVTDEELAVSEFHHNQFCESLLRDSPASESLSPAAPSGDAPDQQKDSSDSKDGCGSDSISDKEKEEEDEKVYAIGANSNEDENDVDPIAKKRKRQLRNRDAAMRSRERKKMYVKDLEIKSRYLEAECRRLGNLLQCCYAENHMLRLSLQGGGAFGNSMTRAESAVLLLESLLLGSLLWFMGIMCLFPLPRLLLLTQDAVLLENVDKEDQESVALRRIRSSYLVELWMPMSYLKSKRCRASWTKMKYNVYASLIVA
uniref:BZIP12 n=1 Tax=Tamarix hispida TaxID=189793 RepID=I7D4B0_9CARY|nr:bZIP12 [Tamarix hispida]